MESIGARLKKKRLEKGITVEEVHKKTKIHLDILTSIEDDSFVNLNPVYIKGFLKIYCQFLGVDPTDYIAELKKSEDGFKRPNKEEIAPGFFKSGPAEKHFFNFRIILIAVFIIAAVFLAIVLVRLVRTASSKTRLSAKQARMQVKVIPKQTDKPRTFKPKPAAALNPVSQQSVGEPAENAKKEFGIRLGIQALDDCWIQLKIDGRIIFQNILKKGRFESWQAKEKAELILGSAGAVRLEINNKVIPALGRIGQVVKNIVITKDGWRVGK
jgi:cytoskeletal protein RodZ